MHRSRSEVAATARRIVTDKLTAAGYRVLPDESRNSGRLRVCRRGPEFELFVSGAAGWGYPMWTERRLSPSALRYVALVRFPTDASQPELYLIPTVDWEQPEPPLVNPQYQGLKSEPEYGIRLSAGNWEALQRYRWGGRIRDLPD